MNWRVYRTVILGVDAVSWFISTIGGGRQVLKLPLTPMSDSDVLSAFVLVLLLCVANLIAFFSCAGEERE